MMTSITKGDQDNSGHQNLQAPMPISGVSNCYVFKSRLQEYIQKVGLETPVYETTREGPSHQPCFRSTVIVNGARYDSLPGFFNRKAAEQSAAEIALKELAKNNVNNAAKTISVPVHETGLCKNLLQEYAQKMNYAIPTYSCQVDNTGNDRCSTYICIVDIGGIQYIGGSARTKREAEIKAARTALLAIQSNALSVKGDESVGDELAGYMVVPGKRKEPVPQPQPTKRKKARYSRFKNKFKKNSAVVAVAVQSQDEVVAASNEAALNLSDVRVPNSAHTLHGLTTAPPQENVNMAEVVVSEEAGCNVSDVQVPNSAQVDLGLIRASPKNGSMAEVVASKEAGCTVSDVQVPNSEQAAHGLTGAPQENAPNDTQTNGGGSETGAARGTDQLVLPGDGNTVGQLVDQSV